MMGMNVSVRDTRESLRDDPPTQASTIIVCIAIASHRANQQHMPYVFQGYSRLVGVVVLFSPT